MDILHTSLFFRNELRKTSLQFGKISQYISSIISLITNLLAISDEIHLHIGAYFVRFNTCEKFLASISVNAE